MPRHEACPWNLEEPFTCRKTPVACRQLRDVLRRFPGLTQRNLFCQSFMMPQNQTHQHGFLWVWHVSAASDPLTPDWRPRLNLRNGTFGSLQQPLHFFDINLGRGIVLMPHHLLHPGRIRVIEERKRRRRVP